MPISSNIYNKWRKNGLTPFSHKSLLQDPFFLTVCFLFIFQTCPGVIASAAHKNQVYSHGATPSWAANLLSNTPVMEVCWFAAQEGVAPCEWTGFFCAAGAIGQVLKISVTDCGTCHGPGDILSFLINTRILETCVDVWPIGEKTLSCPFVYQC